VVRYNAEARPYAEHLIAAAAGPGQELQVLFDAVASHPRASVLVAKAATPRGDVDAHNELNELLKKDDVLAPLIAAYYSRIKRHPMSPTEIEELVTRNVAMGPVPPPRLIPKDRRGFQCGYRRLDTAEVERTMGRRMRWRTSQ